jgi:hypothetical protein
MVISNTGIKAFTVARDFKTPDLSVMPGRLLSEQEQLEQDMREQLEREQHPHRWTTSETGPPAIPKRRWPSQK